MHVQVAGLQQFPPQPTFVPLTYALLTVTGGQHSVLCFLDCAFAVHVSPASDMLHSMSHLLWETGCSWAAAC